MLSAPTAPDTVWQTVPHLHMARPDADFIGWQPFIAVPGTTYAVHRTQELLPPP